MVSFQFNAKRLFLTYSQTHGLTCERIRDFFIDGLRAGYYTIGRELHSDGGIHFHALIQWTEAFRTRNPREFDIDGHHPNISGVRNINNVYQYVTKHGDVISNFHVEGKTSVYGEIVLAPSEQEFWNKVKALDPKQFVINRERLEYYARWRYGVRSEYRPNYTTFRRIAALDEWIFAELQCPQKGKWSGGAPVPCLPNI